MIGLDNRRIVIIAIMMILLAAGIGIGWGFGTTVPSSAPASSSLRTSTTTQVVTNASTANPYSLTLVEVMGATWNSTTAQPKYLLLGPNGLESSANLTVPVNTLIQLTIVSYDTPTPGGTDQEGNVSGTVGGNIFVINGTTASMSNTSMQWGMNVTSVPGRALAHTFSIPSLGVNIPVLGGDTVMAYLRFNQTGTFQWFCETPCGLGPSGTEGAMSTPGWMEGQITVA